jgi:hypothetical protein
MLINNIEVTIYDIFEEEIEVEDMMNEEVEIVKIVCNNDMSMDIYVKTRFTKYAHEYKPSESFSNMTWSHGLSGKNKPAHIAINSLLNNPELERCCSSISKKVGHVGVYVQGNVLLASNVDLMSMPTIDGHRGIDLLMTGKKAKEIIYNVKDIDNSKYSINDEIILKDMVITGIWAEEQYVTTDLVKLSEQLNLNIEIL